MRKPAILTAATALLLQAAFGAAATRPAPPDDPANLVVDGGFERLKGKDWSFGWSECFKVVSPGWAGGHCLQIVLPKPDWKFAEQMAEVPAGAVKLRVRCAARLRDVVIRLPPQDNPTPAQQAEAPKTRGAKVFTLFHDPDRERIGGWVGLRVGAGTRDWQDYDATIPVPPAARTVRIAVGLEHAGGSAWFDDVRVEALDRTGRALPAGREVRTDTRGWYAFQPPPFDDKAASVFDACPLTDAPAGRHGFVTVRNGRLCFADAARARFWGVNLIADGCFPDHRTAERLAACLARFGCNMVRMVFLDAPQRWWGKTIFAPGDDTRHLDPSRLDELDYLVAQLKRRGIYVDIELLSRREFRKGDGVRDHDKLYAGVGLTPALLFNPRLIELQKEFARQLLSRRNPYTHLPLAEDPALAMLSLMNENSMLALCEPLEIDTHLAESYQAELTALWNAWLRERYGQRAKLAAAWGKALRENEKLLDGSVALSDSFRHEGLRAWTGPRLRDCLAFFRDVESRYVAEMRTHLRGLGVRVPVCGSARLAASCRGVADYVDHHTYWDHPSGGWGWDLPILNASILAGEHGRRHLTGVFADRLAGKPFTVTEWDFCWPNELRCEGPVVLATCGAAQDTDCLLMYGFGARGEGSGPYDLNWRGSFDGAFRLRSQPMVFCQWPVANMLFVRGDVDPLAAQYVFEEPDEALLQSPKARKRAVRIPDDLFRKGRLARGYVPGQARQPNLSVLELPAAPQLSWPDHAMVIDTARAQGAVGAFAGAAVVLGDVRLRTSTAFCSLTVASLTREPLARSRRVLVTAVARAENTGTVYGPGKARLKSLGHGPILIEPVRAQIELTSPWPAWTLTPLDANGCRRPGPARRLARAPDGQTRFRIGDDRCLWYELAAMEGER